jgi:hypothetical protein
LVHFGNEHLHCCQRNPEQLTFKDSKK